MTTNNHPNQLSIIIPAHNEESVIGRCLNDLLKGVPPKGVEVLVVCNGCTDKTAQIASTFKGVEVICIDTASKIAALNTGDSHANYFPRVYLDADISVDLSDLRHCITSMQSQHKISAPLSQIELASSSWPVKAFYKTWMQLPYYKSGHMVGSGIYILTKEGRERFEDWPQIIADDAFVRSLFSFDEIYVDPQSTFTLYAPTRLTGLIKIRTRARFGNMQLEQLYPQKTVLGENGLKSLLHLLLKQPSLLPSWITYFFIQLIVINKCRIKLAKKDYDRWERDDSARL